MRSDVSLSIERMDIASVAANVESCMSTTGLMKTYFEKIQTLNWKPFVTDVINQQISFE